MSTKFLSPGWRMPRNANQSKQSNYSMVFDGSNYVSITGGINVGGVYPNAMQDYTISMWFNAVSFSSVQLLTFDSSSIYKFISIDSATSIRIRDGVNQRSFTVPTMSGDNWYNIVVTVNNGSCKVYLDSTESTTGAQTVDRNWSIDGINGYSSFHGFGSYDFIGQITEVSIFDYAFSPSQVTTLWGGGTSVSNPMALPSPPIAYYPLGTSAYNGEYLAENNAIGDYVFDFDGSNDITVSHNSYFDQSVYSFSFWINNNLNSGVSNDGIITADSSTRGWSILQDNQTFKFNPNISGGSGQTDVTNFFNTTSTWIHCAITFDGTNLIIYKNGTSVGSSSSGTRNLNSNNNPLTIGNNTFASGRFFNGKLSNVQIFDSALSTSEVETLYNYGSPIRTLANIPQSSNLKAWYKLDASEVYNSTTTEWSIDNNQNPSAYASSLNFNGSSNYIDCGDNDDFSFGNGSTDSPFSISSWVNMVDATRFYLLSKGLVFSSNYEYLFNTNASDILGLYLYDSSENSRIGRIYNTALTTFEGQWIHICATYNGSGLSSGIKLYLNGTQVNSLDSNSGTYEAMENGNRPLNIGRSETGTYANGSISNVSVWNTELTSPQVSEIYNNGTPSNLSSHSATSNLVSWYKLNNTTTGIEDAKGSNNGTNNGAIEYTGFVNKLVGDSSGMSQANLVQSDLQTVAPYSKYAMYFDAASVDYIDCGDSDDFSFGNGTTDSPFSVSAWVNFTDVTNSSLFSKSNVAPNFWEYSVHIQSDEKIYFGLYGQGDVSGSNYIFVGSTATLTSYEGSWINLTFTYDGSGSVSGLKIYLNESEIPTTTFENGTYEAMVNTAAPFQIGRSFTNRHLNGSISNVSVWNTALTSTQITEIYNQGLPSNLNSHSAYSNLVSWWQLGENSSFDGNDWIVADEKGTNNGTSVSMPVGALVNGVGTTANGVSSGMSEGNLVGDAPYSTANALSTNMVITSRGIDVPPSTSDSDASAFFSRVTTAGGSLSTTEEQAVNTLVTDLKSANIWSKMSAIYPLVGASAAACAQNLKSSSYTGTFDGAWTYASTGVTGNGENNWMNTGLLPSTELSLNSTHLSVYSRTDTPTVTGDVDMGVNATAFTLIEIWGGKFYSLINQNATGSNVSVSTSLGHFIGSRISSSEVKGFRNGSTILTSSTNSTNLATSNIALAAMGAAGNSSAREYAFASIGEGLTDAEVSDFYTAVQAFQTTLSRNV
jgi:hypothetical protein